MATNTTPDADIDPETSTGIDPNNIQGSMEDRFNSNSKNLQDQELSSAGIGAGIDQLESYANDPKNREEQGSTQHTEFTNKFTGGKKSGNIITKLKGLSNKKKAAIFGGILSILGIGSVPFLGTATLPFAIVGNMNAKSLSHGIQSYMEEHLGMSIFGFKGKTSASFDGDMLSGLTNSQIRELTSNGVKLEPEVGIATKNGKKTFSAMTIDGSRVTSKAELSSLISSKPTVLKKILVTKTPLWKAAKSATTLGYQSLLRAVKNPKLPSGSVEEKNKSMISDATGGGGSGSVDPAKAIVNDETPDDVKAKALADAEGVNKAIAEDMEAATKAISEGKGTANPSNVGNLNESMAKGIEAGNLDKIGGTSLGSKVWGAVNALEPLDFICTIYQTAHTASTIARTVMIANAMRTAIRFIAMVEKYKAGDGQDMEEMEYFMDILQKKDPTTGMAFDQSAAAQFLLTGKINDTPPTISAVGGAGIKAMYSGLLAIHSFVGAGSARNGRIAMRDACNIITNLGVQIGATLGSLVVGFFTGGTSYGAQKVAGQVGKVALKDAAKRIATNIAKKVSDEIAEKGILGMVRSTAWRSMKSTWGGMSGFTKASITLAGAGTFAMPFIVEGLTGGDVANALNNGFDFMEMTAVGFEDFDFRTTIANGGLIMDIPTAQAYVDSEYRSAQQTYIASLAEDAKKTPFDITNQYSAFGSIINKYNSTFSASSFSTIPSSLLTLAATPQKIASMVTKSASADNSPTVQEINNYAGEEAYAVDQSDERVNIAVQLGGSPFAGYSFKHSLNEVLEKLGGTDFKYSADSTTEKPKLEIIPGSGLEEYRNMCHNAQRTELNPQFWNGVEGTLQDSSNALDIECRLGGKRYNSLYTAAIAYMTVINPSNEAVSSSQAVLPGTASLVNPSEWAVDINHNGNINKSSDQWTKWVADIGGNGNASTGVLKPIDQATANICSQNNSLNQDGGGNLFNPNAAASARALINAYNLSHPGKYLVPGACFRSIAAQRRAYSNYLNGGNLAAKPGTSNHGWGLAIDFRISNTENGMGESIRSFSSPDYKWMVQNSPQFGWVNPVTMRPSGGCSGSNCEAWHFQYVGPLYGN